MGFESLDGGVGGGGVKGDRKRDSSDQIKSNKDENMEHSRKE